MTDVSPKLLKQIKTSFEKKYKKSHIVTNLQETIDSGNATYNEVNEFAIEVGELLAKAFQENLSEAVLPDGRMYFNIAKAVVEPMMKNNYDIVSKVAAEVQNILNASSKIGIKAIEPALNQDRIDGIINRISNEEHFDEVKWILGEPVVNFTQSIVDDSIKANAEFQYKAGLTPKIIRTVAGNCCEWCRALAGEYSYPDVPKDVYRRHQRCRCTVNYHPGDGKVQNVHTKVIKTTTELQKIENRKQIGLPKEDLKEIKEIKTFMEKQTKELSNKEQAILREYTGFTGTKINHAINTGRINPEVQLLIEQLDIALKDGIMPKEVVLHRDTSLGLLGLNLPKNPTIGDLKRIEGYIISNDIFTSMSFEKLELKGRDTEIHYKIPTGYKGCQYIRPVAIPKYKHQEEVLFVRNLSYIIKTVTIKNSKYVIEAEVLVNE